MRLLPQTLRLRPRSDGWQSVKDFSLTVMPEPISMASLLELDGNTTLRLWFADEPVDRLEVSTTSQVETHCTNPFNYILEPWAVQLPIDYPTSLMVQLRPYLQGQTTYHQGGLDPVAIQLAHDLHHATHGHPPSFLNRLNQEIYQNCAYAVRETGSAMLPGMTWQQKKGSCRDFTVLFMEVCRAVGLAARFVSGYHETEPGYEAHLHAWAEVYLPGAGWRGYDPTQGLAVTDKHVALVAAPTAIHTMPIQGAFRGAGAEETMGYHLSIQTLA